MKKKRNLKKIGLAALGIAAIGFIGSAGVVSAYQGNPDNQSPNYDAALHNLKVDAFDNDDFQVWKNLMEDSPNQRRVLKIVNEENFNLFVEAHNAAMNGDLELAEQIRAELGLNNRPGSTKGSGHRIDRGKGQHKEQGINMQQNKFVDIDKEGLCDNDGTQLSFRGQKRR